MPDAHPRPICDQGLSGALSVALERVPFYKRLWAERCGSVPSSPPPLAEWPTWSVAELRGSIAAAPPFGDLYVSEALRDLAFVHSSTGTTGEPRIFPVPRSDLPQMDEVYRSHMEIMGIGSGDVCAVTLTFGLSRGAWSQLQGAQSVGATVVPLSSGKVTPTDKVLKILDAVGVTVFQGTGSYFTHLTRRAHDMGFDTRATKVRLFNLTGEAISAENRRFLENAWDAKVVMNFASTDLSWVAAECDASSAQLGALGMHVTSGVHAEILDEDGHVLPAGEAGELAVTSWLRPSTPRIRFRTGDCTAMTSDPCPCGSDAPRILPIQGRVDDAVRFHGQTIWASGVEDVLTGYFGHPVDFLLEIRPDSDRGSVLAIKLPESTKSCDTAPLATALRSALNVRFVVEFMDDHTLQTQTGIAGNGKVRRVFDLATQGR